MWLHFKRVQYAKDQLIAMPMPPAMRRVITAEGMPDGSTSLTQRIIDRQTGSLYRQDCTIILSAAAISGSAGKV
jgi:hypothetical protein